MHLLIYKFTSPCSDKSIMLTMSASQTDQRIPSQNSHCQCHLVAAVHELHLYYSLSQFMMTIVKPQCPVLDIWAISRDNVLCKFLSNSLQPSFSLYVYSFVHEWLWLNLLRILWMLLLYGTVMFWNVKPESATQLWESHDSQDLFLNFLHINISHGHSAYW